MNRTPPGGGEAYVLLLLLDVYYIGRANICPSRRLRRRRRRHRPDSVNVYNTRRRSPEKGSLRRKILPM